MDKGQIVFIISQLVLGAFSAFLAIMFWSRTRDAAWMFVIFGVIVAYIEIVYSILDEFGMGGGDFFPIGSVPVISFVLPLLRIIFFIVAFLLMLIRQFRKEKR